MVEKISELGILPVIKIENSEDAKPLAEALIKGELPAAEITFRTNAAKASIGAIAKEFPEMLVGAGTVLTASQVDDALGAGATFIVTPGLNPKVVEYCLSKKIPVFPGINNPAGIEQAMELGLDTVKFFPAEASGGLPMLKAMSAPYGSIKFMPTGGVNAANIEKYLAFNKVAACGGSWMVPEEAFTSGDFSLVTRLAKEAVMKVLGFKFIHLGINSGCEEAAGRCCNTLESVFGFPMNEGPTANFMGTEFEVMKTPFHGEHGHIGFSVNSAKRALAYLARKGINIMPGSERKDSKGNIIFAYLDMEISGFAVHITQK